MQKGVYMVFVFSLWFAIAIPLLIAGIVACAVVFFKMDKKDRQLIAEFTASANEEAAPNTSEAE